MSNLTDALIAAKLVGGSSGSGGGSGSGGDVGMLIMPYDRMGKITQYIEFMDSEEVRAKIQAHPTGWDEDCTPTYFSSYPEAEDYEETFVLHFGNIDNTADLPSFDVTLNLYGVHYEVSCRFEVDGETGDPRLVMYNQATKPLYDADVVTLISSM